MSTISGTQSCTFVRPYNSYTINNSYYITAFGNTLQGTQVYSISKDDDNVTTLENAGTVSNNSGKATLQVMDLTGRILSSESIQGCHSKSLNLSAGVYVVRLSNGNDVKRRRLCLNKYLDF
jgi:hypothetical protein